jgi:predicted dehydrogenase
MKTRWGVLGVAKIAIDQVIPALQLCPDCELIGIASRDLTKAEKAAAEFGIPKAYGSYDQLLRDPEIQVVYIPLPNHLHVPWIEKCLQAGKHVLCEKPLALNTKEIKSLIALRNETGLMVSEAFMVKSHPQWARVKEIIDAGDIGEVKTVHGFFSYNLEDKTNVRYVPEWGGGGLYDVGCYPIFTARHMYDEKPSRVIASIRFDEDLQVDVLVSAIVEFPSGQLTFTSAMQLVPHQLMQFYGTKKRIELQLPFNPLHNLPATIEIYNDDIYATEAVKFQLEPVNQYSLMCNNFSQAIVNNQPEEVPLEDSLINIAVIEALFMSTKTGSWVTPDYS